MKLEVIPIEQINPSPCNPRKDLKPSDPEYIKIKNSIVNNGLRVPLVWNQYNGFLVDGHQRLKVLKELGEKRVTVSVVRIEDKKVEMAMNLSLNHAKGKADKTKTAETIIFLDDGAFPREYIPFADDEMEWWVNYKDGVSTSPSDSGRIGMGGGQEVACPECGSCFNVTPEMKV